MFSLLNDLPDSNIGQNAVLAKALDPGDPSATVVAWPGRRMKTPLQSGDVIVRQPIHGAARNYIVTSAQTATGDVETEAVDVELAMFGGPAGVSMRLHGPDKMLREDLTIVRLASGGDTRHGESLFTESPPLPPAASRPTIRYASRGPAVTEAQHRLNQIDAKRTARSESRIDRCPLVIDGIFGTNTRAATTSFQRLAFAGQPSEWDGVIGPKTWAQLDAWSYDQPVEPPPMPPPPPTPDFPITPVIDRPLDPARWAAILQRPSLSGQAKLRLGNAVRPLIDGRGTFEQMEVDIRAANGPKDYIYLLGWDIVDDFDLVPKNPADGLYPNACPISGKQSGQGRNIINLLQRASDNDVQVRVMLWAKPPLSGATTVARIMTMKNGFAIRDDKTTKKTPASTARLGAALLAAKVAPELIPVIVQVVWRDLIRMFGAHHQKVLIVKRGETLVAYCGGVDINANRLYAIDPAGGDPQHDTHCRIVGPSAWDLLETFKQRWLHHPIGERVEAGLVRRLADPTAKIEPLRGASEAVPLPVTKFEPFDVVTPGTSSVMIARTFNPVRKPAMFPPQHDIQKLLLASIAAANRFIYIEDQYLFDYPDAKFPLNKDIASALNAAIKNIQYLTILIPGNKISLGEVSGHYRKNFINRLFHNLSPHNAKKIGIYQLSHNQEQPVFGCHDYVHSKCWVFDDEMAVIGSANCNRRGYQHDSEVNAFIFSDPLPEPNIVALSAATESSEQTRGPLNSFAQAFRAALWREHLQVDRNEVEDGVLSAPLWRKSSRAPHARITDFNPNILESRLTNDQAEALREFIDPVP